MHADSSRLGHLLETPVATVVKYSSAQHLLDDSHGLMLAADLKAGLCDLQEWASARIAELPLPGEAPAPSRQVRRQLERAARKASGGTARDEHHGRAFTRAMAALGELTLGYLVACDADGLIAHGADAADLRGFLMFVRDEQLRNDLAGRIARGKIDAGQGAMEDAFIDFLSRRRLVARDVVGDDDGADGDEIVIGFVGRFRLAAENESEDWCWLGRYPADGLGTSPGELDTVWRDAVCADPERMMTDEIIWCPAGAAAEHRLRLFSTHILHSHGPHVTAAKRVERFLQRTSGLAGAVERAHEDQAEAGGHERSG
jgi:hypothetical protein